MSTDDMRYSIPRKSRRVPFKAPVHLKLEELSDPVTAVSKDISLGGIFISLVEPVQPGSLVAFEFQIGDVLIEGTGEVAWIRSSDEGKDRPAGTGLRFRYLSPGSRERIFRLVQKHARETDAGVRADGSPPGTPIGSPGSGDDAVGGRRSPLFEPGPPESLAPPRAGLEPVDPRAAESTPADAGAPAGEPGPGEESFDVETPDEPFLLESEPPSFGDVFETDAASAREVTAVREETPPVESDPGSPSKPRQRDPLSSLWSDDPIGTPEPSDSEREGSPREASTSEEPPTWEPPTWESGEPSEPAEESAEGEPVFWVSPQEESAELSLGDREAPISGPVEEEPAGDEPLAEEATEEEPTWHEAAAEPARPLPDLPGPEAREPDREPTEPGPPSLPPATAAPVTFELPEPAAAEPRLVLEEEAEPEPVERSPIELPEPPAEPLVPPGDQAATMPPRRSRAYQEGRRETGTFVSRRSGARAGWIFAVAVLLAGAAAAYYFWPQLADLVGLAGDSEVAATTAAVGAPGEAGSAAETSEPGGAEPGESEPGAVAAGAAEPAPDAGDRSVAAPGSGPAAQRPATGERPSATPATVLETIRWQRAEGGTVLVVEGNGGFPPSAYEQAALVSPPRLLVKLRGIRQPYDPARLEVGTAELRAVRSGLHGQGAGSELHLVLDLASAEVQAASITASGNQLRILLARP